MPKRRNLGPRFAVRSADLGRRLDTFLAVAIASVLGNRLFLVITGYPQLGNGTLHISHAIWGAAMMAIAIIISVSFLGPFTRSVAAFLGGAGFGWFIDELGKFITRDVNYFFQPTFALIYMTFIGMYLAFRSLERRNYSPEEGMLNALEAVKAAALGQLDEPSRREALALFDTTNPSPGPFADRVRALLGDAPALPPEDPSWPARVAATVRRRYTDMTAHPRFPTVVDLLFLALALVAVIDAAGLGLDGPGVVTFSEWAALVTSVVAGAFIVVGALLLHHSRVEAYRWFDRGLLVHIYVVQIFVFAEEQLAGTVGLIVILAAWTLLRSAMRAERDHEAMAVSEPAPAKT